MKKNYLKAKKNLQNKKFYFYQTKYPGLIKCKITPVKNNTTKAAIHHIILSFQIGDSQSESQFIETWIHQMTIARTASIAQNLITYHKITERKDCIKLIHCFSLVQSGKTRKVVQFSQIFLHIHDLHQYQSALVK